MAGLVAILVACGSHRGFRRRRQLPLKLVKAGSRLLAKLWMQEAVFCFRVAMSGNIASLATFNQGRFWRVGFLGLWRFLLGEIFSFYRKIWFVPGEVVLMHGGFDKDAMSTSV